MYCKDCLVWQNKLGDNQRQQFETIPNLVKIGFTDTRCVSELYYTLDVNFRELVVMMDSECPNGSCVLEV